MDTSENNSLSVLWLSSTLLEDVFETLDDDETLDDLLRKLLPENHKMLSVKLFYSPKTISRVVEDLETDYCVVDSAILFNIIIGMKFGENIEDLLSRYLGFNDMFHFMKERGIFSV